MEIRELIEAKKKLEEDLETACYKVLSEFLVKTSYIPDSINIEVFKPLYFWEFSRVNEISLNVDTTFDLF